MARPPLELPTASAIRALVDEAGRLAVRVTPGARTEAVELRDGQLLIKVRTVPEAGKANERVMELLAEALGTSTSRLHLLRGATGRDKLVQIRTRDC